ncbi:MAG TPA: IPT/TIG domain-containing protein [Solirubrobacteraceae bacterium]|jgi:hypothetical protein|nr:IPT/TIG domain-containing protein [Solirubrobacteraceae bacterium]
MDGKPDRPAGGRAGLRAGLAWAATVVAGLLMPVAAHAEVVTIGTPVADFATTESGQGCAPACTVYQLTTPVGLIETAPAAGVIIDWRVLGSGTLTLETLRPTADGSLSVVGSSAGAQSVSTGGSGAIAAHVPVLAGDSIGVHLSGSNPQVRNSPAPGDPIAEATPDVPSPPTTPLSGLLFLDADVAITPVVTSISPTSGITGGGTVVTITGQYLDGSTAVRFGTRNASSFTVLSPTEIIASAPAQAPGTVDVTVAGPGAASATSSADQFTYVGPPASGQTGQQSAGGASQTPIVGGGGSGLVLSPLSLTTSYFLAAASGASIARTATGTTVTYTVSAPATTTFVVQEVHAGRLLPANADGVRECVALNKATLPIKLPACSRYVSISTHLTHRGPAGRNVVHFTGRLAGHALAPGSYRLLATARSTGTPTVVSASVTHAFHILKPPTPGKPTPKPKAHAALPTNGSGATSAPA